MVTVNLISQRLREVHFVNHVDKSGQIQLTSSFNFHVDYAPDNSKCVAKLYQSAKMKEDEDKLFVSAEIEGIFVLEGVVDEETKREAHVQCYNYLFPYLQAAVNQLSSASGMPGFLFKKNPMRRENIVFTAKGKPQEPPMTLPIV